MSGPNVVEAQLETPAARFVTLLMDRLQSLEQQMQQMQSEASRCECPALKARIHALEQPIYLKGDLFTFSDGLELQQSFEDEPATLYRPSEGQFSFDCNTYPLDNLHAKAVAFTDVMVFDIPYTPSPVPALGRLEIGTDGKITTVEEMITATTKYCKAWKELDIGLVPGHLQESREWKVIRLGRCKMM